MPKRVDSNQKQIVADLREMGYKVAHTHELGKGAPDILVGGFGYYGDPLLLWVEVKIIGGKLTDDEKQFHFEWRQLPVIVARTAQEIHAWFYRDEISP